MAWDLAYKGRMTVVDPFTGSAMDLAPNFPDIYQSHLPGTQWVNATNVVFSPDQSQAVYLRDDMVDPVHQIVLWDIKTKTALWQRFDRGSLNHTPEWSPDGSAFAVAIDTGTAVDSQDEIFLVDRTGFERQLTTISSTGDKAVIRGLTWAPVGRSLAFWLDYRHANKAFETEQLGLLDLTTGQMTLYCFGSGSARPVWSPDSSSIVFEIDPVNEPPLTILLDLARGNAYQLAQNAYPAAWLKSP
jgi:Tol biopolymer transport system component